MISARWQAVISARRPVLIALAAAVMPLCASAPAQATGGVVVFPTPGTRYNRPATQITFRGVPAGQIAPLQVAGSRTGVHRGRIAPDSDGQGGSFLPFKRFAPGEKVTVVTHLAVLGGSRGTFAFTIAHALGLLGFGPLPLAPAAPNGVQRFHSRPDLLPPAVRVTKDAAPASQGDIFVAPQNGPEQNGPMILDPHGRLVWFSPHPVKANTLITDFRVQQLFGQPVLTWWQGNSSNGLGRGVGMILNRGYEHVATVRARNGLDMDLHEFLLTPGGGAYLVASAPVQLPGLHKPVIDSVVQEIDVATGLVLFEWHAMDHVPLGESYFESRTSGYTYDPFHVNSVGIDRDGSLIISARNTSTVYKVDRRSGRIVWRLGGKRPTFRMGPGTPTWGQHNALVQPDGTVTLFDDGAGPPTVHPYSRAIREALDTRHRTTRLIEQYDHSPRISANFEGNAQPLRGGDLFLGWGQQPYFSEDDASGRQIFDAHFAEPTTTYRAYRFGWSAQPAAAPDLAATLRANGAGVLYASWNGATGVAAWRVLAGRAPTSLTVIGSTAARGFETALPSLSPGPGFAVQALGPAGEVLATSPVRSVPSHLELFGAGAFVSRGGTGALPVGCYALDPCRITATVSEGGARLARSAVELIPPDTGKLVYFRLSAAGRARLARARNHRLSVQVGARDHSGAATATATIALIPFRTSGPGPRRSFTQAPTLQIMGGTDFVSSGGVGGILVACRSATPCRARMTVAVGGATVARTGPETVDATGLRYVIFSLTRRGRALLAHAPGNQLAAMVTVRGAAAEAAAAHVALVRFK